MPWDRSTGTDPKYRTREHKAARLNLVRQLKHDGYLLCTAVDCVFPTREITQPNGRERAGLHLGHEDNGIDLRGPEHNACNVKDGARRGRAKQNAMPLTPGLVRPGAPTPHQG